MELSIVLKNGNPGVQTEPLDELDNIVTRARLLPVGL
jgi:hypothetical protein